MSVKHILKKNRSQNRLAHNTSIVGLPERNKKSGQTVQNSSYPLDPAEKILLFTEETKKRRQQDEVQLALLKIQQRVNCTLNDYEDPNFKLQCEINAEANIEGIEDPAYLYELLRDSQQRSKYLQRLSALIYGFEEKCEDREQLLSSLYDFFLASQAVNPQKLFDQVEENEFDFNGATSGLQSAMDTAHEAAKRLLAIKQEMSKLVAISAAFPDTKKGRKKMENALLKAQDEVNNLSTGLTKVQAELKDSTGQIKQLQQQIEVRNQECVKLRSDANNARYLEVAKEKIWNDLKAAQNEIQALRVELQVHTKTLIVAKSELKTSTPPEHQFVSDLLCEKEMLQNQHREDLKLIHDGFKVDIEKVKAYYEKQLRSQADELRFSCQRKSVSQNNEEYDSGEVRCSYHFI